MRIFGLAGLLVALVIVGLLAKKQFATIAAPALPAVPGAQAPAAGAAPANAREQSQQIQQQYKQAIDAAMQTPRKMPDDN